MKNLSKTTFSIIAILFVSMCFIQCKDAKDAAVTKYLELQAEQLNKQFPMNMGAMTMEKCTIEGKTIKLFVTINSDVETFDAEAGKTAAVQSIKNSPEAKQSQEFGISYAYEYKNASGKVIGEINISPEDYK
ncbi:type II secretion system pilot lipoprotein GspS-beta [Prevotella sp. 10(H)]|uniref:type II secretion system pilot lipoprotein GspS-beta n=1 Tax=Prevotella sp. 10(H) TaxID=1158294 RepID=UPI0004A76485|nr:type II secretion system pilot lipoprotein GspS-beta [Prevotella sp. 10(H)]